MLFARSAQQIPTSLSELGYLHRIGTFREHGVLHNSYHFSLILLLHETTWHEMTNKHSNNKDHQQTETGTTVSETGPSGRTGQLRAWIVYPDSRVPIS